MICWYRHISERWFHARLTIAEGSIVSRCLGRSSDREPVLLTANPGPDACQACRRELEHAERPAVAGFLGVDPDVVKPPVMDDRGCFPGCYVSGCEATDCKTARLQYAAATGHEWNARHLVEVQLEAFDEDDVTKPVHERFDHGDIECGGEA